MAKLEESKYLQGIKEGDVIREVYTTASIVLAIVLFHKQGGGYTGIYFLIFSHF